MNRIATVDSACTILRKAAVGIILTGKLITTAMTQLDASIVSEADSKEVLEIAESSDFTYAGVNELGKVKQDDSYMQKHINQILALPLVDINIIAKPTLK